MNPDIRRVPLADVLPLRQAILRPTQSVDELTFDGDEDPEAVHLAVGDPIVGITSVVPTAHPAGGPGGWRIRMVGVVEERRGAGIGARLVSSALECARERDADEVWLSARLPLREWYEALGFEAFGEVYEKPPVGPHLDMRRSLGG